MITLLARALTAALCGATSLAVAQTAPPGGRADPLDARATVPPMVYRSSLPMAQAAAIDRAISWREANDNVARIGGWRSYAREVGAAQPQSAAPMPAASGPAPVGITRPVDKPAPAAADTGGHSGHAGHGGKKSP